MKKLNAVSNKMPSHTRKGPGRYHVQGNGRTQSAMKYPGTHRAHRELPEKAN